MKWSSVIRESSQCFISPFVVRLLQPISISMLQWFSLAFSATTFFPLSKALPNSCLSLLDASDRDNVPIHISFRCVQYTVMSILILILILISIPFIAICRSFHVFHIHFPFRSNIFIEIPLRFSLCIPF